MVGINLAENFLDKSYCIYDSHSSPSSSKKPEAVMPGGILRWVIAKSPMLFARAPEDASRIYLAIEIPAVVSALSPLVYGSATIPSMAWYNGPLCL